MEQEGTRQARSGARGSRSQAALAVRCTKQRGGDVAHTAPCVIDGDAAFRHTRNR